MEIAICILIEKIYFCETFRSQIIMASNIKELIRKGEDSKVEFKKTLSHLEKIAKTLVSFANSRGGTVLIGIQDDKQVIGVSDPEEEMYMLDKAATFYARPEVSFSIIEEELHGKKVLVVDVPESQKKPHRSLTTNGEWHLYVRSGSQCLIATPLVARSLEMEKEGRDNVSVGRSTNNELALFRFLDEKRKITLKEYAKLINVSKRRAYRILMELTLSGKLYMHDFEHTIFYTKS
jgi:predicted HTH transcriptional regulator